MRTASTSLLILAVGCGSSSSPTTVHDGGADGTAADATDDACFPLCGSSSSGSGGGSGSGGSDAAGDGPASCASLSALVSSLEGPARACNPQVPGQCTGTTQGPCCAITVSAGNDTAVNNYAMAVAQYVAQCMPVCMTPMCPAVPTMRCDSTSASGGACQ
jgi:hypothetical protein